MALLDGDTPGMGSNLQHEDDQCDKKQLEGRKVIDASVWGVGGHSTLTYIRNSLQINQY